MARPKKPSSLALVDGSGTVHPKRYDKEPVNHIDDMPLGPPGPFLDSHEMGHFVWFVTHGYWLTESDRASVEEACRYWKGADLRTNETKDSAHFLRLLEKLGFTPVTRGAAIARYLAKQSDKAKEVKPKDVWAA